MMSRRSNDFVLFFYGASLDKSTRQCYTLHALEKMRMISKAQKTKGKRGRLESPLFPFFIGRLITDFQNLSVNEEVAKMTTQKGKRSWALLVLTAAITVSLNASATETQTINVSATVPDIFEVSFNVYKDPDPVKTDEQLVTDHWLPWTQNSFAFTIAVPEEFSFLDDDGGVQYKSLGSSEVIRILVGVLTNRVGGFKITQSGLGANGLVGPGGATIDGAFVVAAFVDPGDGRTKPASAIETPRTKAAGVSQLYKDPNGNATVVQVVYGISNGYTEDNEPISGVDLNDLVGPDTKSGSYSGTLTLTVEEIAG